MTPESEVIQLGNKKMGRPTDNPKTISIKFKADKDTAAKLRKCSEEMNVSRAEILRRGVHRMYEDLPK